jgi:hypothetical protein
MSKRTNIKTTLLNIDSAYRTTLPKNICQSNCIYLPNNPLTFTKGSNIINIYYPDHKLITGDNITIQNVEGNTKIINNSVYLITDFKYIMIVVDSIDIDLDYKNYISELYCNIDIVGEQTESNLISNITFNSLIGVKKCLLINDIAKSDYTTIESIILSILNTTDKTLIEQKCLFIEIPVEFNSINNQYIQIKQIFKISYLHIGGIKLGYLNANYPINNYNYQSNFEVYDIIDSNHFLIKINYKSYGDIITGGNKIIVMKILDTLIGYPDADEYIINLKKSFTNITNIELVSTEFPYVDIVIKKNVNDKLYWKNIEDGNTIYNITIDEGFYSSDTFIKQLHTKMNQVKRINYTILNKLFNYFDIILENNLHKITFKPYNLSHLPNSLSIREEYINTESYFILTVKHPNNIVDINDTIIIMDSDDITITNNITTSYILISNSYINKEHIVYTLNLKNASYDIILGKKSDITTTVITTIKTSGENVIIKSKSKASFLFNYPDTFGDVLGFRDVGTTNSILDFSSVITNYDSYMNSINVNFVGNIITYPSNFMNFVGNFNYFLMYLNDIEYIYLNNNLPSAFAKIQLSGNPGDILFNTFIATPSNIYYKGFPIQTLTDIHVKFLYPDGSRIYFRNINHSFTLKITEEHVQNDNTYQNSQSISVLDELQKANLS